MCQVLPSDARCRAQESTADKADKGLLALMKHTATELARLTGPPPGPPKNTTLVQFRDPVLFYNSTAQLTQTQAVAQNLTERAKRRSAIVACHACRGEGLSDPKLVQFRPPVLSYKLHGPADGDAVCRAKPNRARQGALCKRGLPFMASLTKPDLRQRALCNSGLPCM